MIDIFTVQKFSWFYFVLSFILTILPFLWVFKRPIREKLYILPFVVFFFIYSGAGVAWEQCEKIYLIYYFIWMSCFALTLNVIMKKGGKLPTEGVVSKNHNFILKRASIFIFLFFSIKILSLASAGKLHNLISPPTLDIYSALEGGGDEGKGLLYYLENIVFIFYFVSLYKYRYNVGKLFGLLFFPFYIEYANSGYVARSTIMAYLIIYFVAIYFYNPNLRRKISFSITIGLPFLVAFLAFYTYFRRGAEVDVSTSDAITLLAYQETSYPIHFLQIQKQPENLNLLEDYFQWLTTLPFPGFMKDTSKDYFFNAIFTERLYGIIRGTQGFYILLPGIVNEGLFIFGKWLFPLHAIILAFFVGFAYRIVRYREEFLLFLYISLFLSSLFARAGTVSTYPTYLKYLLIYEVLIWWVSLCRPSSKNKKV